MTMVQAGALYGEILDQVSGRVKKDLLSEKEKKKGLVH